MNIDSMTKRIRKPFRIIPLLIIAIIITVVAGVVFKVSPIFTNLSSTQTVAADAPFKTPDKDNKFCPEIIKYPETWLSPETIGNTGKTSCYDICNPDFIKKANEAYLNPKNTADTPKNIQKRIDRWLDRSDESEGEGGKAFKTMAACEQELPDFTIVKECAGGTIEYRDFSVCLSNRPQHEKIIDTTVRYVTLTVPNVRQKENLEDTTYYYCLRSNPQDCDDDEIKNNKVTLTNGSLKIDKLCGDGSNKLKANGKCRDDGRDFFHPEKTYSVTFYEKEKANSPQVASASFYVSHFYPTVAEPKTGIRPELSINKIRPPDTTGGSGGPGYYDLTVKLVERNEWGNRSSSENDKHNDYWLVVEGFDNDYISENKCLFVAGEAGGTATIRLGARGVNSADLTAGKYLLKIVDGRDGNLTAENTGCKEGDFTYYFVPFLIGSGDKPGEILEEIKDPYGKELGFQRSAQPPTPICPTGFKNKDGNCTRIETALGAIRTQPQFFVRDLFRLILGIGGIAALIFFIQAGYTIMTSAGNKEKIGQAREQITSVVLGLIFIILSIAILEFIGVRILQLPGFGSTASPTVSQPINNQPVNITSPALCTAGGGFCDPGTCTSGNPIGSCGTGVVCCSP